MNMITILPKNQNSLIKCNFIFQASSIWNALINKIMNKCPPLLNHCKPEFNGRVIPGSVEGSDLAAPVPSIKRKVKEILLGVQKLDTPSQQGWKGSDEWRTENFFQH